MKIKAGNDERVWLFFRNIILIGGLLETVRKSL